MPKDWKTAEIVAVFKKGSKSEAGNYRPIKYKLTCICCKLFKSLNRDFTENNVYFDCQHGFRKRCSYSTQVLQVMEELTKLMDERSPVDIIYLDYFYSVRYRTS